MSYKTYMVEIHCVVEVDAESDDEAIETALGIDTYDLVWDADILEIIPEEDGGNDE